MQNSVGDRTSTGRTGFLKRKMTDDWLFAIMVSSFITFSVGYSLGLTVKWVYPPRVVCDNASWVKLDEEDAFPADEKQVCRYIPASKEGITVYNLD